MPDYDEYYDNLNQQRSRNERQQRLTRNEITALEKKIARLRAAYSTIDREKEYVKSLRRNVKDSVNFYESGWKGAHAGHVYEACEKGGSLYQSYSSYIDSVDDIEDSINREIARLNNLKAQKWGFLSGLVQAWNNLTTEIRNYFN